MPNTFVNVLSDNRTLELPVPASTAISIGDICYWDSSNKVAKPITSLTTAASEVLDQVQVAQAFVGIALDARLSTEADTGATRLFLADGICDLTLYNDTFNLGSLVGATWAGGSALVTQTIRNVAFSALSIGRVIKQPASGATKVRCRVQSRIAWDLFTSQLPLGGQQGSAGTLLTDAAQTLTPASNPVLNMVPTAARNVKLPVEANSQGLVFYFTNNSAGAFSVTFQTSAGGAIKGNGVVPQNKTSIFWYDTNTTSWCGLVSA